jgi:hypothetical protein
MPLRAVDFSTPIEMLTGTTSFKVHPKKFGCVCFVHNTSVSTSKLDAKSYKCVFVEYSSEKGYKCYDPIKKRMFESLDVTFRKTEPYFVLSNAQSNGLLLFPRTRLVERGSIRCRTMVRKIL